MSDTQRMSDERWAEIIVDDGYPMTDFEIELMQALKAARNCFTRIQDILDDPSERNIHEDIQKILLE